MAISSLGSVPELRKNPWPARTGFVLTTATVNWIAFEISRRWFYSWPGRPAFALTAEWLVFSPLLSVLLVAFTLHQGLRRLAMSVGYRHVGVFVGALALVGPLSWLTAVVLQPYGGHQFDDVKAGYPVFWVNIMVGTACALVARLSRRPCPRPRADSETVS